jgi:hypothetical protein
MLRQLMVLGAFADLLVSVPATGEQSTQPGAPRVLSPFGDGPKRAHAVRVPAGTIRLDGRLDDEVWGTAVPITDFVQKEPVEGAVPSDAMEVRLAYDDTALYVGARMSSSTPIQAGMSPRDQGDQAERVLVSLDTYLDRRTSSTFGVTATGVRLDHYHSSDDEWNDDEGYNPVWRARSVIDDGAWTAELWIPFAQLRFNAGDPQVWGLNIQRFVPSRNEEVFWVLVPRTEERWASLFGDLHGIAGIGTSRRLELLPYAATDSLVAGDRDPGDPFHRAGRLEGRVGVDVKMGLGSNLTLEATVNPDFGQIEADPAEVNLSAFETFFDERRPFFLEGSRLLRGPVNSYFYSRRIGAPPAGDAEGDYVQHPPTTTILGAAKLTGRLASGLSVGVLGAATGEEFAETFDSVQFGRVRVAPRATYAVARAQQEFGSSGSSIALMSTAVHRQLDQGDPLAALLARAAFTVSGDSILRFRDGEYEIEGHAGLSYVGGNAPAIDRLQRSSARYLHRPDAGYLLYDPRRTSLVGTTAGIDIERRTGRHWLWEASARLVSPEFETNDLGRLSSADATALNGRLEYRDTVPGPWWRSYSVTVGQENEWNFDGDRQRGAAFARVEVAWPNFWEASLDGTVNFRSQNDRLTRGGPSMEEPLGWRTELEIESSDAAETRGDISVEYGRDEDGGLTFGLDGELSLQPGPRWQLSMRPGYEREVGTQQYVTTVATGSSRTFGRRYVFAHIDRSTYSTEFRLNYTFKPDLTLDLYAEPFAASGRYDHFGELAAARSRALLRYGTGATTLALLPGGSAEVTDAGERFVLRNRDFGIRSFRSNVVLRWEWRPGSTLYLVWQQDRAEEEMTRARTTFSDMFGSLGAIGDNRLAVKVSFWLSPR